MERKLIGFGKSSYVVSLPKGWVENNGLKKGSIINVEEKDGFILIAKNSDFRNKKEREISINIDDKSNEFIEREIRTAYINNYNIIILHGKDIPNRAELIRGMINELVALEIMEQSGNRIVAKDFLNVKELSLKSILKRMDMLTRSMLTDSLNCNNENDCSNIYQRDEDANKLCFLIFKLVRMSFNDSNLAVHFQMSNDELLDSWELASRFEDIADASKRIAKLLLEIKNDGEKSKVKKLYADMIKYYVDVMRAYYKSDRELAENIVRNSKKITESANKMIGESKEKSTIRILDFLKVARNSVKLIGIQTLNKNY